ncbi:TPA: hypothetical protein ACIZAI_001030 [Legionella pneumophila]
MKTPPKLKKDKITIIQKLFQKTERKAFHQNYTIKQPIDSKLGYTIEELEQKNDEELDKILGQFVDFREYFELEEEKKAFYSQPDACADFKYWARQAYWTIDEGIALIFGKDPRVVNWENIYGSPTLPFVTRYKEIHDITERYEEEGILLSQLPPATFLDWVKKVGYPIPPELTEEVGKQELQGTDWHSCFLKEFYKNKQMEEDTQHLRHKLEDLEKKGLSEKTLLNILGVAIKILLMDPMDGHKPPFFKDQKELMDFMTDRFSLIKGISKSTLYDKFKKAIENV